MKDVKKLLAEQSKQVLPDRSVKENIKRELGYTEESRAAYAHGGTQAVSGRKKKIALLAAALAAVLCLCIVLPIALHGSDKPGFIDGGKIDRIDSADEFYAYSAASVGTLLSAAQGPDAVLKSAPKTNAGTGSLKKRTFATSAASAANGLTDAEQAIADTVDGYLGLIESLLSEEAIEYTAVELGQEQYGYRYRMTVTVRDMLGDPFEYTMFYDKVLTESETDGDETEEEYAIDGILLVGGKQYPVSGEKETENEEDESELSLQFTAYRPNLAGKKIPYLRMEQESEEEDGGKETEKFFLYTLYDENGRPAETTSVEYEEEEGELELKMTVRRGEEKDELWFWREDGRKNILSARARIGGEDYRFTVMIEESGYRYEFSDGNIYGDPSDSDEGY